MHGSLKMYQSKSILGRGKVLMVEKELKGSKGLTDMAILQPNCRVLKQISLICLVWQNRINSWGIKDQQLNFYTFN
jgi:hypothetical protein